MNFFLTIIRIIFLFAFCFASQFSFAQKQKCKLKPIVKNCESLLSPYEYDSYAEKEINYSAQTKKDFFEIQIFADEECKLVFCQSELPQTVGITIYDRKPSDKNRKIIYFDESGKKDQYVFNFRPTKTGSYFVEYEIPPATAPNQKGCIVMLIGTKEDEEEAQK